MADTAAKLDEIDRSIIRELQGDSRLTRNELAQRVRLSPSAVADRVRRLEDRRVILRYTTVVDARKLGYDINVIMRVAPGAGQLKNIARVAKALPEVIECHRVTGEDCYVLHIVLPSINDLEGLVDRFTPLGKTTTSIVNGTPVPRRAVPVGEP